MDTKMILGVIAVLVIIAGGYFIYQGAKSPEIVQNTQTTQQTNQQDNQTPPPNSNDESVQIDAGVQITTPKTYEVLYANSGYSPAELTIKQGDTVVFKNQSSGQMWTATAMHPAHTGYDGTSLQQHCQSPSVTTFDECKAETPGSMWSFTFTQKGSWGYHNHVKANHFGKIIVE